jgi:hypothetical protein
MHELQCAKERSRTSKHACSGEGVGGGRADDPGHELIRELAWNEATNRNVLVGALL